MINKEKIITLIGETQKALGELFKYTLMPDSEILSSSEMLGNIKYQFIIAIESCIDICNHISAQNYSQTPESYSHCFKLLGDKGAISNKSAEGMAQFSRFRNLLVHLYWKVDDEKVIKILKEDIQTIKDYLSEIIIYTKI
jgi:uncharacterized protein YutE (UPF0331/DUF86 family)